MKSIPAAIVALLACVLASKAHAGNRPDYEWGVRANLVRWATLTPCLGAEYRFRPRWAVTADYAWGDYSFRDGSSRYALSELTAELRHYPGQQSRLYTGLYVVGGEFNYKFSKTGRQGNHLGIGLSAGYQLPLSRCWLLDLGTAVGWLRVSKGERYKRQDELEVWREDFTHNGPSPLAVRVALVYTFPKKGGSK